MNDKLNEILDNIDESYICEAATPRKRRPVLWYAAAAMLAIMLAATLFRPQTDDPTLQATQPTVENTKPTEAIKPNPPKSPDSVYLSSMVAGAKYPAMAIRPNYTGQDGSDFQAEYNRWLAAVGRQYNQPEGYADSLADFFAATIPEFLDSEHNSAYSPLNVYMALAMLAETTDGNTRQQILELLNADSIEALRQQAEHVWNAHYRADGETTTILGNSLWLDSTFSFREETTRLLADHYFASVFHGDLGSDAVNQDLRTWLNSQTGGLLKNQADSVHLEQGTAAALASTLYFAAVWEDEFHEKNNEQLVFHCSDVDLITEFMTRKLEKYPYYCGSNFSAVALPMSGNNTMWLILPDEGVSLTEVTKGTEYLEMILDPHGWDQKQTCEITLKLPKFDITDRKNLADTIQKLGVTDVFRCESADFSPLTDASGMYISAIDHAVRVTVDEEGCTAAAFTMMPLLGMAVPQPGAKIDFILDRPFLFAVSSRDDLPLFVGTVCKP